MLSGLETITPFPSLNLHSDWKQWRCRSYGGAGSSGENSGRGINIDVGLIRQRRFSGVSIFETRDVRARGVMFNELDTRTGVPRQTMLFLLQQCLVPLGTAILGLLLLEPFLPTGSDPGLEWPKSILYAFPCFAGFLQARVVDVKWRGAVRTGQWIWVLPALSWAHDVLVLGQNMPLSTRVADMFRPSGGGEGLPLALQTIPTFACICYSIQMFLAARRWRVLDLRDGTKTEQPRKVRL